MQAFVEYASLEVIRTTRKLTDEKLISARALRSQLLARKMQGKGNDKSIINTFINKTLEGTRKLYVAAGKTQGSFEKLLQNCLVETTPLLRLGINLFKPR